MPNSSLGGRTRSQPPVNDWTGRAGAIQRTWPSEQMIRLVCRAVAAERRTRLTVADIGCGNGRNAAGLASLGFGRVIAVDPLQSMLEATARQASASGCDVETRMGKLPGLPFQPQSVDIAVCWGLLFTLGGTGPTAAALAEIATLLRPGGLLIADWRTTSDGLLRFAGQQTAEATFRLNEDAPAGLAGMVYSFFSAAAIKSLHAQAGLELSAMERNDVRNVLERTRYSWWQTCARRQTD